MFYYAMLAGGTDASKAKIMYYAVYVGAHRWKSVLHTNHEPRAFSRPGDIDEMRTLDWPITFNQDSTRVDVAWIEASNPSLEEIETRAQRIVRGAEPPNRVRIDRE